MSTCAGSGKVRPAGAWRLRISEGVPGGAGVAGPQSAPAAGGHERDHECHHRSGAHEAAVNIMLIDAGAGVAHAVERLKIDEWRSVAYVLSSRWYMMQGTYNAPA